MVPFLCGENFDGSQLLSQFDELFTVLYSFVECNFGKSFRIWVVIQSSAFTWKKDSVPTKLVSRDATL